MIKMFSDPIVKQPPDALISKNEVLMNISNYQMGTNPHSEIGDAQYQILNMLFRTIEGIEGIPINK